MQETLEWLYNLQRFGIKPGLGPTKQILEYLGNPHQKFPTIHVAGTNGKGSTCAMLAQVLQDAGYKTALYTSPHLISFNERFQINGEHITNQELLALIEQIKQSAIKLTFFEASTAIAFAHFAKNNVDIAVIETGVGGLLDATNVITPLATIITNVQEDHMPLLGDTLQEVARKKAGIIKERTPIITAEKPGPQRNIIQDIAKEKHAPLTIVEKPLTIELSLKGKHQQMNAALAYHTIKTLSNFPIKEDQIIASLKNATFPARLQEIDQFVIDGAHNLAGIKELIKEIKARNDLNVLILALSKDKPAKQIIDLLSPLFETIILTKANFKPMDPQEIKQFLSKNTSCFIEETPQKALERARALAKNKVLIAGSLYLAGDCLKELTK